MKKDKIYKDLNLYNKSFNNVKRKILAFVENLGKKEIYKVEKIGRFSADGVKTGYKIYYKDENECYIINELSNLENNLFLDIVKIQKYIINNNFVEKGDINNSKDPFKKIGG